MNLQQILANSDPATDVEAEVVESSEPVVDVEVPKVSSYDRQFYAKPSDNFYNARGDKIKTKGGIFTPASDEEQEQLEYQYAKGRINLA